MAVEAAITFVTATPLPPTLPGRAATVLDVGGDRVVRHGDRVGIRGAVDRLLDAAIGFRGSAIECSGSRPAAEPPAGRLPHEAARFLPVGSVAG